MEVRFRTSQQPFALAEWEVDPARLSIRDADGNETRIRPRSMAVLTVLVAARGEVVRKSDLMNAVWPRSEVTEGVLSQAMLELRTVFADDPKNPRVIETIRRVGFRLIPPVRSDGRDAVVVRHPAAGPEERSDDSIGHRGPFGNRAMIASAAATALLLAIGAGYYFGRPDPPEEPVARPFIMVTPFEDLSTDRGYGYFARGIGEEIALRLASSDELRLFSGHTLQPFLDAGEKPIEIAERYGVDLILTGSVRRDDDEIRLLAELSDARTGQQRRLWTYERPLEELFDVEDDIARTLIGFLTGNGAVPGPLSRTSDLGAYDYYLRGREFLAMHRDDANEQAISLFREALALDPAFATARASLAEALAYRGYVHQRGGEAPLLEAIDEAERTVERNASLGQAYYAKATALTGLGRFAEARAAAEQALLASPHSSDAAFAAGYIAELEGDLIGAASYYTRALEIDPGQPRTVALARLIYLAGDADEAVTLGRRADRLAPGIPTVYLAHLMTEMGRHEQATALCARLLAVSLPRSRNLCAFGALVAGDSSTAERLYAEDWRQDPRARFGPFTFAPSATHLAWIRRQSGNEDEVTSLLAESERVTTDLLERGNEHWSILYNLAAIAALRGRTDAVFDRLDQAYAKGLRDYRLLEIDPIWRPLLEEPRFEALHASMKRDFDSLARVFRRDVRR